MSGVVHICRPETVWERRIMKCPTCNQRRRFVGMVQLWYDTIWTCCTCGDAWSAEGRMDRPFCRNWRTDAARRARRSWLMGVNRHAVSLWLGEQLAGPEVPQ